MAATKEPKGKKEAKTERVTLKSELFAVANGKPVAAEDAAAKITERGRYTGQVSAGAVARCARHHDDAFSIKDDVIRRKAKA